MTSSVSPLEDLDNLLNDLNAQTNTAPSSSYAAKPQHNDHKKDWEDLDALVKKHDAEDKSFVSKMPSEHQSHSKPSEHHSSASDKSSFSQGPPPPMPSGPPPPPQEKQVATVSKAPPTKLKSNPSNVLRRSTTSLMAIASHCGKCGIAVVGEHTVALNKVWHPEHFACHTCHRPITGNFYDHEGVINCVSCAQSHFNCSKCHGLIEGEYFMVQDKRFHPNCADMSLCFKCRERITGAEMIAMGKHYHESCFCCSECDAVLPTKFFNRDGEPICANCNGRAEAAKRILCRKCSKPVSGSYVSYEGGCYHDECFNCGYCGVMLPLDDFYTAKGQPSCYSCAMKHQ